jgi:23S rRNA G2445 N2-methylase RlmL
MATSRGGQRPIDKAGKTDLATSAADAGFTPSVKMLSVLFELFREDDEAIAKDVERAILRIENQYASRVASETVAAAKAAERPARGRLAHLAGRLAQENRDPEGVVVTWLLEALSDADPKTRRAAARAFGKLTLPKSDARSRTIAKALEAAYDAAATDDDKRALALALGKVGSDDVRGRLAGARGRVGVIAERELARRVPGAIDPAGAHDGILRVRFHTRSGLEDVLKEELGRAFGKARFVSPGVVEAELEGPLSRALAVRTALHVGFPLEPSAMGDDLAADIVRALCAPASLAIFRAFSAAGAAIRFRLAFVRGGHRRSVVWRCAELVRAETRELVNDPKESTWEVLVDDVANKLKIELVPRAFTDTRFGYREELVAASSSPVIAAALARIAPRSDADVVWDPFAGAGAELVERALIGPYGRLVGTDVDARAVGAARANVERAGIERVQVEQADACEFAAKDVDVIITNPPMGRRVERGRHADLLERFVAHAANVLVPGGSLVWLVPEPERMRARASASGLDLDRAFTVDMGGFSAELSVWVKRIPKKQATEDGGGGSTRQAGPARQAGPTRQARDGHTPKTRKRRRDEGAARPGARPKRATR